MKNLFMESAEISPDRTISQIEAVLIQYGATAVLKEYQAGSIEAVSFKIKIGDKEVPFRLPCRWQAIAEIFIKRKAGKWNYTVSEYTKQVMREKARRVAWRQILRWVEAQMALVDTSMVTVHEVFFQYISTSKGTVYEVLRDHQILLEGPK